jgi:hypothetical protein
LRLKVSEMRTCFSEFTRDWCSDSALLLVRLAPFVCALVAEGAF